MKEIILGAARIRIRSLKAAIEERERIEFNLVKIREVHRKVIIY